MAPGGLFVAIAGEHDDGHQFVPAAARAGAVAILVHDLDGVRSALADAGLAPGSLNLITVSDTVEALGRLARAHLADLRERAAEHGRALTVVAMTGSVGKTTTKDLTRQILAAQAPTIAPAASFNNEIGLPPTEYGWRDFHANQPDQRGRDAYSSAGCLNGSCWVRRDGKYCILMPRSTTANIPIFAATIS